MGIKEIRKKIGYSQKMAAELCNIPLRTYINYENDSTKENTIKYMYILNKLSDKSLVDETHGILSLDEIKTKVNDVLSKYDVKSCILFGSYARGEANEKSDVDLAIVSDITGLSFYGVVEELRTALSKKVDVLDIRQLMANEELLSDILKEGIRIYGEDKR